MREPSVVHAEALVRAVPRIPAASLAVSPATNRHHRAYPQEARSRMVRLRPFSRCVRLSGDGGLADAWLRFRP
jgi:hypothetical protein